VLLFAILKMNMYLLYRLSFIVCKKLKKLNEMI